MGGTHNKTFTAASADLAPELRIPFFAHHRAPSSRTFITSTSSVARIGGPIAYQTARPAHFSHACLNNTPAAAVQPTHHVPLWWPAETVREQVRYLIRKYNGSAWWLVWFAAAAKCGATATATTTTRAKPERIWRFATAECRNRSLWRPTATTAATSKYKLPGGARTVDATTSATATATATNIVPHARSTSHGRSRFTFVTPILRNPVY